jgi:hypothetical protein
MDSAYPQLILVKGDANSSPNSFEDTKPQTDSETDPKQITLTGWQPRQKLDTAISAVMRYNQ